MTNLRVLLSWAVCLTLRALASAQETLPSSPCPNPNARFDCGWGTRLAGPKGDRLDAIATRPDGSIVVAGRTEAGGIPVTAWAFQRTVHTVPAGGRSASTVAGDAYIARYDATGQLLAATYFGGSDDESSIDDGPLSADAFQRLVRRHAAAAVPRCPSLAGRNVTPHTLRHAAAMDLLRRGVDITVIALWLGHESIETTHAYLHADMQIKEKALAHASTSAAASARYAPDDSLLAFLSAL